MHADVGTTSATPKTKTPLFHLLYTSSREQTQPSCLLKVSTTFQHSRKRLVIFSRHLTLQQTFKPCHTYTTSTTDTPLREEHIMGEDGNDLRSKLVVLYKQQAESNISALSLGDQSYISDLAQQKKYREEMRQEEAMEEALELYNAALEEGAPKSVGLFKTILAQVLIELQEEYKEKDRLQDEWLETARQEEMERQQQQQQKDDQFNHSNHSQTPSYSFNPVSSYVSTDEPSEPSVLPSPRGPNGFLQRQTSVRMQELDKKIYEEDINIFQKKLNKAQRLIKELIQEKGETAAKTTIKYKNLNKKVKEYRSALHKAMQEQMNNSDNTASIMYDWGADNDDGANEPIDEQDGDIASTSTAGKRSSDHLRQSQIEEEDLEWAKNVVAQLSLKQNARLDISDNNDPAEAAETTPTTKRTPHKNISMSTVMATTRRVGTQNGLFNSHNKKTTWKPSVSRHQENENEEDEESPKGALDKHKVSEKPTITVSPNEAPDASPGKRKSPSWKTQLTVIPTKQISNPPFANPPFAKQQTLPKSTCPSLPEHTTVPQSSSSSPKEISAGTDKKYYTLEDFQNGFAKDVDMEIWETFLSPAEFEKHFGMTTEAFGKLPKWKRLNAKRALRTW